MYFLSVTSYDDRYGFATDGIEKGKRKRIETSTRFLIYILTSTKNASLIITDFLAMIYKNEQPCTVSVCRGWAMLENDFNLICR